MKENEQEKEVPVTYLSQMDRCQPTSALSTGKEKGKWQLLTYETDEVNGTMISASSYINAPDVTLPLDACGWHAVYVGYLHPFFAYDGRFLVKLKLTGDAAFRNIPEPGRLRAMSPETMEATYIREVFFKTADLTGQDLVIGKSNGALGKTSHIAYVKLVPLSPQEVERIQEDRARTDTRNLVVSIDGSSHFFNLKRTKPEHILELVEQYRYSDVGKVLWAVVSGSDVLYPSQIQDTCFQGDDRNVQLVENAGTNSYIVGETQKAETLTALAAKDIFTHQIAAEHAHAMGVKFEMMFRLGIGGGVPPGFHNPEGFVSRHPEFRQVLRDGTAVEKASYAFPEVRQFMLSLIRESVERFDADGINLCFVRGPHFLLYEKPVLDAFRSKYGQDAREFNFTSPRICEIRAGFMTDFVRRVRQILNEVGQTKGKQLELSVWVWPMKESPHRGDRIEDYAKTMIEEGLDIKTWLEEDLLNSIICKGEIDRECMDLCKAHDCKFFLSPTSAEELSPRTITQAYKAGVNGFAIWDIDGRQYDPEDWTWTSRIGHREEMENWKEQFTRLIRVKKIAGSDLIQGLFASIYSGG